MKRVPQELLRAIASFLLAENESGKVIFQYSLDWRNFINATKDFMEWKRETRYLSLTREDSKLFWESVKFREKIDGLIKSRPLQLKVFLDLTSVNCPESFDISAALAGINMLVISQLSFDVVTKLTPESCTFKYLNFCSNVKKLIFSSETKKMTFDLAPLNPAGSPLEDFSLFNPIRMNHTLLNYESLQFVKSVTIVQCESIVDVSCFHAAETLNLSYCWNITDVHALGHVSRLNLTGCTQIQDISALGNVPSLNVSNCPLIDDISCLTNVKNLDLGGCLLITDLSSLQNVEKLSFRAFQGRSLVGLKKIKSLTLAGVSTAIDLRPVRNTLTELTLTDSPLITDITMLNKLENLIVDYSSSIIDFTGLSSLRVLRIFSHYRRMDSFQISAGLDVFKQLKVLALQNSFGKEIMFPLLAQSPRLKSLFLSSRGFDSAFLSRFSFPFLTTLSINNNSDIDTIPAQCFPHLQDLKINNCSSLEFLPELPNLNSLTIQGSFKLIQLNLIGTERSNPMEKVSVVDCRNLKEIVVLRRIGVLTVTGVSNISIVNSQFVQVVKNP
jgi:hypothetical protein